MCFSMLTFMNVLAPSKGSIFWNSIRRHWRWIWGRCSNWADSQHLSPHTSSQLTQCANFTPSPHEEKSECEFQRPNLKQRKESSFSKNICRKERKTNVFEDLVTYPGPPQNEDEIHMFFKAMAVTVKKFQKQEKEDAFWRPSNKNARQLSFWNH